MMCEDDGSNESNTEDEMFDDAGWHESHDDTNDIHSNGEPNKTDP